MKADRQADRQRDDRQTDRWSVVFGTPPALSSVGYLWSSILGLWLLCSTWDFHSQSLSLLHLQVPG